MRLAIMSDIHGNMAAFEAVLADIAARGPFDALGVAGDLCEWGPQPREVLARVRDLGCPVVQGNTDRNVTFADDEARLRALGKSEQSIKGLAWTRAQLGRAGVDYLATLPFAHTYPAPNGRNGHDVLMVHANPRDIDTHLDPDMPLDEVDNLLADAQAAVITFGHLHTPYVRQVPGHLLVDVSSVGYPRDGDRRAAYAILEWDGGWRAEVQRVPYDLAETAAAFRACDIPNAERRIKQLYRASYGK
jgi:predicted phosphodiesterase